MTASSYGGGVPNATTNFGHAQTAGRTITVESGAVVLLGTNKIFGNQQGDPSLLPTLVLNGGFLDASRYNLIGPVTLVGGVPATVAVDGVTYESGGTNDLSVFDQAVSEIIPALTGNPEMSGTHEGWSYRTFRLDGAVVRWEGGRLADPRASCAPASAPHDLPGLGPNENLSARIGRSMAVERPILQNLRAMEGLLKISEDLSLLR